MRGIPPEPSLRHILLSPPAGMTHSLGLVLSLCDPYVPSTSILLLPRCNYNQKDSLLVNIHVEKANRVLHSPEYFTIQSGLHRQVSIRPGPGGELPPRSHFAPIPPISTCL